ncbi:rRNA maturation RNase YbeY [Marivita sp. GX14005]|uniref:rRNA maturation RNase YbeY n=1 Tax=Marivita sp. GX14005 TaxID=2942276 RepID=UPI00201971F0|nr:rRNA maturation RNase YbeY [Marivita sp. GX14005]MCL3882197.1 rRNA maturation RNase YbeY [Marivita sp. GX14005]
MTDLTDTIIEDARWNALPIADLSERAALSTLNFLGHPVSGYEISVLACDDDHIAELNAQFRGKPTPTNVLSWPAHDLAAARDGADPLPPPPPDPRMGEALGDIAIAYETCVSEARAASKPLENHVTHLLVHGLLHLLGYDHLRDGDATLMEGLEKEILGKMGLPDPYRD